MSALVAEDLRVEIDGVALLDGVSCRAEAGRLTGLIGPNGAGKSTLLRALLRLQPIRSGKINWAGEDITDKRPHELARAFAYLAQSQTIHWPLSVGALVALGRRPAFTPFARLKPDDAAAIDEALALTELTDFRTRSVTSLSGGERARALLARVLAARAAVVLADEPVAALDPYHQLSILETLKGLAKAGAAVIIVLHDLALARRFCDDVILLDKGRVAAAGRVGDIMTAEHLEPVYRVRLDVSQSGAFLPLTR